MCTQMYNCLKLELASQMSFRENIFVIPMYLSCMRKGVLTGLCPGKALQLAAW